MYKKIIEEVAMYADSKFAEWQKPFLSINDNSTEIIIGVRAPILRKLAKKYKDIELDVLKKLLTSNIHEHRALAIFVMLIKSKKEPNLICGLYLQNLDYINNWDLIDYSAPHIVAPYITKRALRELAQIDYLWANRVAMVSTIYYIKQGDFELALEFAEKFIDHEHHLMHKAAGWMLREVGKQDVKVLKSFLNKNSSKMPSIMKSYAREKIRKL